MRASLTESPERLMHAAALGILLSLAGVTGPTQKLHLRNARLWLRDGCAKKNSVVFPVARSNRVI